MDENRNEDDFLTNLGHQSIFLTIRPLDQV